MQVRPILYTVFIAFGFALLANSWVVHQDKAPKNELQKSSLSGFNSLLPLQKVAPGEDSLKTRLPPPIPVRYDTSDVSERIQDLVIEARIKKMLFKNASTRSANITVKVAKGHVVLDGDVDSMELKRLIESTVQRVKGVVDIESNIQHV